jgi:Cytochrome b(C-terminal)/b6/petD
VLQNRLNLKKIDLLPFYAILRSIPDKLGGVIAMVAAILILLAMPVVDNNTIRGNAFRAGTKVLMGIFFANFLLLGVLGQEHVEAPFIEVGQVSTGLYFLFYIFLLPLITECETLFSDMYSLEQGTYSTKTISSEINTDKLSDNFIINKLSLVI